MKLVSPHAHDERYSRQTHGHAHGDLTGVTANQHHNQVHALNGADHTGNLSIDQLPTIVPWAEVRRTDNTLVLASGLGSLQAIPWQSETIDQGTGTQMVDLGTSATRITCQKAGIYIAYWWVRFAGNGAAGVRYAGLYKNGAEVATFGVYGVPTADETQCAGAWTLLLAVGDYVETWIYQSSGANVVIGGAGNGTKMGLVYLARS